MDIPKRSNAQALRICGNDNVAAAITEIAMGKIVDVICDDKLDLLILAEESIPLAHKIALDDIKKNDEIIKYGECIGEACSGILKGFHVHVHNIKSKRGSDKIG